MTKKLTKHKERTFQKKYIDFSKTEDTHGTFKWINENFPTSFLFIFPPGCICWNITATSMHVTFTKRGYHSNFGDFSWNCFVNLHKKGMLMKFQLELLCFDLLSIDDVDVLQPTGELYSRKALTPSACQNYTYVKKKNESIL